MNKWKCISTAWFVLFSMTTVQLSAQLDSATQKKPGIKKRSSIAVIPIIGYNRSTNVSLGVMVNAFTKINPADSVSPPSRTGLGLGYTLNKSWFTFASQKLYLKNDKWRLFWAVGLGNYNFQYFDETDETGNGAFVTYQTRSSFFSTNAVYNIYKRIYTGLKYQYSKSTTEFEDGVRPTEVTRLSSWGIPLFWDSRNYVYYPSKGFFANILFTNNAKWLGSDVAFSSFSGFANHYTSFKNGGILASRFYTYIGLGNVPFVGQKVVGGKDLRGYTKGSYRSDKIIALQTEYRKKMGKKWGFVVFGGVAEAFAIDNVPASGLLPAAGGGFRFQALPKQKMNVGVDLAVGKGDYGLYFRFGEAF
jgi:hypothetical protein